jgi:hypothetical protein
VAPPDNVIPHNLSLGLLHPAPSEGVAHFLSFDVKWPCISCSSRTTDHWGVTPHAEGDVESPGSDGAFTLPVRVITVGSGPHLAMAGRLNPGLSGRVMSAQDRQVVGWVKRDLGHFGPSASKKRKGRLQLLRNYGNYY